MSSVQKSENIFDAVTPPRDGYHRLTRAARQKVTEEEANHLLSLTSLSLSTFNVNDCRFVVVRDPDLRKQINKFSLNQFQIPHPASLIILCADLAHGAKKIGGQRRPRLNGTRPTARRPPPMPPGLTMPYLQRDEAMCSCGIAAKNPDAHRQGPGV